MKQHLKELLSAFALSIVINISMQAAAPQVNLPNINNRTARRDLIPQRNVINDNNPVNRGLLNNEQSNTGYYGQLNPHVQNNDLRGYLGHPENRLYWNNPNRNKALPEGAYNQFANPNPAFENAWQQQYTQVPQPLSPQKRISYAYTQDQVTPQTSPTYATLRETPPYMPQPEILDRFPNMSSQESGFNIRD